MLLHGQVRVALEEEDVLSDVVGLRETSVHVAELEGHELVDVVRPSVVLDALALRCAKRFLDRHDRLEHLVLDSYRIARSGRGFLVRRRHRCDRVTDIAHLLVLERALVLGDRQDAELDRQVGAGDHGLHAGNAPRG